MSRVRIIQSTDVIAGVCIDYLLVQEWAPQKVIFDTDPNTEIEIWITVQSFGIDEYQKACDFAEKLVRDPTPNCIPEPTGVDSGPTQ